MRSSSEASSLEQIRGQLVAGSAPAASGAGELSSSEPHERPVLVDRQVLRDLRQALAVVRRHREAVALAPSPGDLLPGAQQRVADPRADDRRAHCRLEVGDQRRPLVERLAAGRDAREVPEPAALQPHEERRRPPVGPLPHGRAGHRHRAVHESVVVEALEERLGEGRGRGHGDVPLHRDDRRDADLGQPGSERGQHAGVLAAPVGPCTRALARREEDQPRQPGQVAQLADQVAAQQRRGVPVVVDEQEHRLVVARRSRGRRGRARRNPRRTWASRFAAVGRSSPRQRGHVSEASPSRARCQLLVDAHGRQRAPGVDRFEVGRGRPPRRGPSGSSRGRTPTGRQSWLLRYREKSTFSLVSRVEPSTGSRSVSHLNPCRAPALLPITRRTRSATPSALRRRDGGLESCTDAVPEQAAAERQAVFLVVVDGVQRDAGRCRPAAGPSTSSFISPSVPGQRKAKLDTPRDRVPPVEADLQIGVLVRAPARCG